MPCRQSWTYLRSCGSTPSGRVTGGRHELRWVNTARLNLSQGPEAQGRSYTCCLFQGQQGCHSSIHPHLGHRSWQPQQGPQRPRGASHLLDVLSTLVVDEDDNGVDVHVVQPLDGVGGDIQETVPVLRDGEGVPRAGLTSGGAPLGHLPPFSATDGIHISPHTALPYSVRFYPLTGKQDHLSRRPHLTTGKLI